MKITAINATAKGKKGATLTVELKSGQQRQCRRDELRKCRENKRTLDRMGFPKEQYTAYTT